MRIFIFFFFCSLVFCQYLFAQKTVLKGTVREDSTLVVIEYANVVIYKSGTKEILSFAETNSQGLYQIELDNIKDCDIEVIALGYVSVKRNLLDLEYGKTYENNFLLKLSDEIIETIEIKAEIPIRKIGDTTIFNASSFSNKSERTLDELIKKIPGLELSDDGSIYFKNKKIDKLLIEGDDLFQENYQIGTKNIPVEIIENLEIIENYQNNPISKNVSKGQETILNLRLKKGIKTKFFGNFSTTYGLKNYREWQGNVLSLSGKSKFYLITQHNNIGFNPLILSSQKIANQIPEGNKIQENDFLLTIPRSLNNTQLTNERANINNVKFAYLGGITRFSKRFSINYGTFVLGDINKAQNIIQTQFLLAGSSDDFRLLETQKQQLRGFTFKGQVYSRYEVSPSTLIEYFLTSGTENRDNRNNLTYQTGNKQPENLTEMMRGEVNTLSQRLSLSQKIDDKKVLIANFYTVEQNQTEKFLLNSNRLNAIIGSDSSYKLLLQNSQNKNTFWGMKMQLLGIKGGIKYKVFTNLENGLNPFKSSLTQESMNNQIQISSFLNNFTLQIQNYSLGSSTNFKIGKADITTLLTVRKLYASSIDKKTEIYLEPNIALNYPIKNNLIGLCNYSYTKSLPEINKLIEGQVLNSYRSFSVGTRQILFPNTHNAFMGLIYVNINRGIFSNVIGGYIQSPNMYGLNQIQLQDFSSSESIAVNNSKNLFLNLKFDKSMSFLSSTLKTDITVFGLRQPSKLFDFFQVNTSIRNIKYSLLYLTNLKKLFNFEIRSVCTSNITKTQIENNSLANKSLIVSIQGKIIFKNKKENILLIGAWERIQLQNPIRASEFHFADVECKYIINQKSALSILARNIFSKSKIDVLNIYANSTVFRSQEILPQLFLLRYSQSF